MEEERKIKNYFESFIEFWIPIYRHQVITAKLENDLECIFAIKENIYKNLHLDQAERVYILKELSIYRIFSTEQE